MAASRPIAIVVDDDTDVREALREFLAREDVEAAEAQDGVEAVEILRQLEADLAFLDLQLPRLDGLSVLKVAKELRPQLAVVMMSGSASPQDMLTALENGAYTFLTKPCDLGLLEKIVHEILTRDLPSGRRFIRLPRTSAKDGEGRGQQRRATEGRTAGRENEKGGESMAIVRWSPFRDLVSIQQEVNRLFDDLMTRRGEPSSTAAVWIPLADMSETENEIVVKLEVPGVPKENIKISVANDVLTVKGEKAMEKESGDANYHRVERVYGSFLRSLELPAPVSAEGVKATYVDGVLTVRLPKSEAVRPKEIPIES